MASIYVCVDGTIDRSRCQKFSKISALGKLVCKGTTESSFQNCAPPQKKCLADAREAVFENGIINQELLEIRA
jgi:hypothetical protein